MGLPVKLSDSLVLQARQQAILADRSLTAQIEHWAKLGRAAEQALDFEAQQTLKTVPTAEFLHTDVGPHAVNTLRLALQGVANGNFTQRLQAAVFSSRNPVYEVNPEQTGGVVQVSPDGTRVAGRFVNRRFVAAGPGSH